MTLQVRAGAQAPERLRLEVTNPPLAAEPLDLNTVSAVRLAVVTPDGRSLDWDSTHALETIESVLTLVVVHEFAFVDIEQPGPYKLELLLTVPSGIRRAGPTVLQATG